MKTFYIKEVGFVLCAASWTNITATSSSSSVMLSRPPMHSRSPARLMPHLHLLGDLLDPKVNQDIEKTGFEAGLNKAARDWAGCSKLPDDIFKEPDYAKARDKRDKYIETKTLETYKYFERQVMSSDFWPYKELHWAIIHQAGHLWPQEYRECYFKHRLLNSLLNILSHGSLKLYKQHERDSLNDKPKINFYQLDATISGLGKCKTFKDSDKNNYERYFKLFNAFVSGLHQNKMLLLIGSNALKGKILEEKKMLNPQECQQLDSMYSCIMTITSSAWNIFFDILQEIRSTQKEQDWPLDPWEFSKDIEVFFANYQPNIKDVDRKDFYLFNDPKYGEETLGSVPKELKLAVSKEEATDLG